MGSLKIIATLFPKNIQSSQQKQSYIEDLEQADFFVLKPHFDNPRDNDKDNPTWRMSVPTELHNFYLKITERHPDLGSTFPDNKDSYSYTIFEKFIEITVNACTNSDAAKVYGDFVATLEKIALETGVNIWVDTRNQTENHAA